MKKTIYRSKIDWWLIVLMIFTCIVVPMIIDPWWLAAMYGIGFTILMYFGIFGCWYAIEGDNFIVYQFFRPYKFPIHKIKEVKFCKRILSGPAQTTTKHAIKFTDRKVLKSSMPIEISPNNRHGFVEHLKSINPDIKIIY